MNDSIFNDSINAILHHNFYQQIDSITAKANQIATNTGSLTFWPEWYTVLMSLATLFASILTIIGFISIIWAWNNYKMSKNCQRAIIHDLVRHMFINNVILEVIRITCKHHNYTCRPIEGVFARFATLETDTDLGRLSTESKHYAKIHSMNSLLRNYNITVNIAEKHFADTNCTIEQKKDDIREIIVRSRRICDELIELGEKLGLNITIESARQHIVDYYQNKKTYTFDADEEKLLKRNEYTNHDYFDNILNLHEILNSRIKDRFNDIYFIFKDSPTPKTTSLDEIIKKSNNNLLRLLL